jgi:adenosylmethionine-8-amino-7-oxononanoate aminotransferase
MSKLSSAEILAIDRQHIWHPYASFDTSNPLFPVASARGVELTLADGRTLIDGMASWWCAIHGYNHPQLNAAAIAQLGDMSHVMFGGLTHEPAALLAQKLVAITPAGLNRVFLADSGSVAVEVAMKMAMQFWQSQGQASKSRFLSLRNGYHGDTFGAMSVCDPVNGMHHLFSDALPQQFFSEAPRCAFHAEWDESYIDDFRQTLTENRHSIAAVILEPIVQGAGGMRFYSPHYLRRVRELCDDCDVLLIADEIATGFGRSGRLFACEYAGITPDILCLGKALTGGYLTSAATLCTDRVSDGICQGEAGVFMHGPTFMANPLACAIANASIDLLLSYDWQVRVQAIERQLHTGLTPCRALHSVADVRVLGAIGVVELKEPVDNRTIQPLLVEQGIWLRPFGKLVYTMPPFVMTDEQLATLCAGVVTVLQRLAGDQT